MATLTKAVEKLSLGDTFTYRDGIAVYVLDSPEPTKDRFGRDMLKVWCRADGREGWVIFGPSAEVPMLCAHNFPERTGDDMPETFTCSQCGEVVAYW